MNIYEMTDINMKETSNLSNPSKRQLVVCLTPLKRRKLDQLEDCMFLVKKPSGIDEAVECPGCSKIVGTREMCAGHLLQECLQLSKHSENPEELRAQWIEWLFKYFQYNFIPRTKRGLSSQHQLSEREVSTNIPSNLQCPICKQIIIPASRCFNHVFKNCLCTKTGKNAVHIGNWIEEYLWSNCKSREDYIIFRNQLQNAGKPFICKYCKKEFPDEKGLRDHFRSSHGRGAERTEKKPYVCTFCNLKPGSHDALFDHLILDHVKCGCCGFKIRKIRKNPFKALKIHLGACLKRENCVCPICQITRVESFETKEEFEEHLLGCQKTVSLEFNILDLYYKCDICYQTILKCNIDIHAAKHIESQRSMKTNNMRKKMKKR